MMVSTAAAAETKEAAPTVGGRVEWKAKRRHRFKLHSLVGNQHPALVQATFEVIYTPQQLEFGIPRVYSMILLLFFGNSTHTRDFQTESTIRTHSNGTKEPRPNNRDNL